MNYFEEIKSALINKGAKGNIAKDTEFKALGIDSLDLMDMVITLEEKLNIALSDDQIMSMNKIDDLVKILEEIKG